MATCGGFALLPTESFAGTHFIGEVWALVITKSNFMSEVIFKYPLKTMVSIIEIPASAKILCVQMQHGVATIWVQLAKDDPTTKRSFAFVGTGSELPSQCKTYIGTIQDDGYVWHIYEIDIANEVGGNGDGK